MRVTVSFSKIDGDSIITPVTPVDAFRLMNVNYIPRWSVPIVDLRNQEVFFSAVLEVRNEVES